MKHDYIEWYYYEYCPYRAIQAPKGPEQFYFWLGAEAEKL